MTAQDTIEIGVTEFKAKCLKLISDLNEGRLREIILTRRGEEVARMQRPKPKTPPKPLYGSMRGSVRIPADADLDAPINDGDWTYDWENLKDFAKTLPRESSS